MLIKILSIFIFLLSIYFIFVFQKGYKLKHPQKIDTQNLYKAYPPTLEKIFSNNHNWTATLSAKRLRSLIATGDIMPARSVNTQVLKHKDFKWPYLKTASLTSNADITFINLETPLIKNCKPTNEGMIFCGDSRNVEGLVYAGVDIANLANNHAGNYAEVGVLETKELLNKNGILTSGIKGFSIKDVRGIKFAFLGYNDISIPQPGISNVDEQKIIKEIREAKKEANIVVVAYHFGEEYRNQPDERQIYLARLAIDNGADLVIGNHPHWIQSIEIYKNKLITYSHGNFVFDQMWSEETKLGVVGKYIFYDSILIDAEFIPIQIEDFGQPFIISDQTLKKSIIDDMKIRSIK